MYGYEPEPEPSLADQIRQVFGEMKKK